MAHDAITVADMVAAALDVRETEISDLLDASPFFARLPVVDSSNGTTHKYSKETAAPVVGFRSENAGVDVDHGVDTIVSVSLKILDGSSWVDQAVAHGTPKWSMEEVVARKMRRALKAAFFTAEKQYIQGTNNDAAGFTGFEDSTGLDALADTMVIDAGGTTASTGSSVYLIQEGIDTGVAGVMIADAPLVIGETSPGTVEISAATLQVYNTPMWAWIGLQIGGARSIARIANLTEDSGKGMTDDLFYKALEQFPVGEAPTLCIGSRRSMRQWQSSRTATSPSGAPAPSVGGTSLEGVDIITVESISDTETLLS